MRRMIFRFFFYIWGAIAGTTFLVVALIFSLDLPPPGYLAAETAEQLMRQTARDAFTERGAAGVEAILGADPSLSSAVRAAVARGTDCAAPEVVGMLGEDSCMILQVAEADEGWAPRLLPLLTPLGIGFCVSVVVALVLARRFVRPIHRVGEGLTALSQGKLDKRIGSALAKSEPAIADVGRAFDVAARRLQELTEDRSRLFHDISHEIRSPLARLQVQTALLRQNPSRLPTLLSRMEADIGRTDRLVEEILTLARTENLGNAAIKLQSMDLIDVLDPIISDARLEGQSRGVNVHYTGPDKLKMCGDPELLHRAFENIIRNALRHTIDDSEVNVTVQVQETITRIAIRDRGPGLPEEHLTSIFQAFIRDGSGNGAGLGLAIASNAIHLHGGNVAAVNCPEGGLVVTCLLPSQR